MQIYDNTIFVRMQNLLGSLADQVLSFCENYLFCLLAIGLWIKIALGILKGRTPSFVLIAFAVVCTALAISLGAFFW